MIVVCDELDIVWLLSHSGDLLAEFMDVRDGDFLGYGQGVGEGVGEGEADVMFEEVGGWGVGHGRRMYGGRWLVGC